MSYQVDEYDIVEITTEKVTPSRKMGERLKVVLYSNSGTVTLYLTEEQVQAIQHIEDDQEPMSATNWDAENDPLYFGDHDDTMPGYTNPTEDN